MWPNRIISSEVGEATARLHALDLRALLEQFSHLPIEFNDHDEPFPQSLRLIISSHCEQRCQYPEEGVLWCHNEGVARDGLRAPLVDSLLEIARFFKERYGVRRAKIGGLEPVLGRRMLGLIRSLRDLGMEDVSFTTHGRGINGKLGELKEAGLTRVTISIQHFERENNRRLTGRDGLMDALALVKEAQALALTPIQINRVLLRHYTDDLPAFIDWVRAEDVTARLFDLIWQPGHDEYYLKYLVSWQEFLRLWQDETERLIIRRYRTSWRTRILFKLRGGGGIEVNLLEAKWNADASICQTCLMAEVCAEGYLGCGIRVTPDLKLSPCILRNDLSLAMQPLFNAGHARAHIYVIDELLRGAPQVIGQPMQLLTIDEAGQFVQQVVPLSKE
jgi:molybdenum cofactor biosynthesis enzyme MoaA